MSSTDEYESSGVNSPSSCGDSMEENNAIMCDRIRKELRDEVTEPCLNEGMKVAVRETHGENGVPPHGAAGVIVGTPTSSTLTIRFRTGYANCEAKDVQIVGRTYRQLGAAVLKCTGVQSGPTTGSSIAMARIVAWPARMFFIAHHFSVEQLVCLER